MPQSDTASYIPCLPELHSSPTIRGTVPELGAENTNAKFMMATTALCLIESLLGEEKPKSLRANRCAGAVESILRVCDMYAPDAINSTFLNDFWQVIDGPVHDALKNNQHILDAAIAKAIQTTQEA